MSIDEPSPLVIIRRKEIELAESIAAARQAAELAVAEARQQAAEGREQAEREGREQAAALYRAELAAADGEADRILAEGERAAAQSRECGLTMMDAAVTRIMQIVLPR